MSRAHYRLLVIIGCVLSQYLVPVWTRSVTFVEMANCASISQACFESAECCSSECHEDRHFCCVPEGAQCLGEDGMCCSGFCDPDLAMCTSSPHPPVTNATTSTPIIPTNMSTTIMPSAKMIGSGQNLAEKNRPRLQSPDSSGIESPKMTHLV